MNGKKLTAWLLVAALAGIFVSSVLYRLEHPSRKVSLKQSTHGEAPSGMGESMSSEQMEMLQGLMRQLQENPNDPATLTAVGRAFMRMRAWDKAGDFLTDALAIRPADEEALTLYGIVLFQQEDYAKAEEIFTQLLAVSPDSVMAHYNLGVIKKYHRNAPDEAAAHFNRALELKPEDERLRELISKELE